MDNFISVGASINQFYGLKILNIFSDASILNQGKNTTGCYGIVAVCCDEIIDTEYRLVSNTTNNISELKGIRAAVNLANKYKYNYPVINIFSDSQISIFGIRDYYPKWRYNNNDGLLYGSTKEPIKNQELFIEIHNILSFIQSTSNVCIRFYHQSGHVSTNYQKLLESGIVFGKSNRICGKIDLNLMRYLATYNNFVDHNSRSFLYNTNRKIIYKDPIKFFASR